MEQDKRMPAGHWIYVWGLLAVFFTFSYVTYMTGGFVSAFLVSMVVAALITIWLAAVHWIFFADSLLYKIVAVILGGVFFVLVAILIQLVYEGLVLKKKTAGQMQK